MAWEARHQDLLEGDDADRYPTNPIEFQDMGCAFLAAMNAGRKTESTELVFDHRGYFVFVFFDEIEAVVGKLHLEESEQRVGKAVRKAKVETIGVAAFLVKNVKQDTFALIGSRCHYPKMIPMGQQIFDVILELLGRGGIHFIIYPDARLLFLVHLFRGLYSFVIPPEGAHDTVRFNVEYVDQILLGVRDRESFLLPGNDEKFVD